MLLAGKAAWAGIVFVLLATGISGRRRPPLGSEANLTNQAPAVGQGERCQEDAANPQGQRTLPRGTRRCVWSPNAGKHSRISEG
jgi:hypothetical protein